MRLKATILSSYNYFGYFGYWWHFQILEKPGLSLGRVFCNLGFYGIVIKAHLGTQLGVDIQPLTASSVSETDSPNAVINIE